MSIDDYKLDVDTLGLAQRYLLSHAYRILIVLWAVAWVVLLLWGWSIRDEDYIHASSGLGYLLGMVGGGMILLLLTYSVRKRMRWLQRWLHLRHWFRVHMVLGVMGPTCILFHSGFSFGSPNSSVALLCLLGVALSGLFGRFLYSRVHSGIYGEKLKLVQIRRDFAVLKKSFAVLSVTPFQQEETERLFEQLELLMVAQQTATLRTLRQCRSKADQIALDLRALVVTLGKFHSRGLESEKSRELLLKAHRACGKDLEVMLAILKKLPGLHVFERMFSLWHVAHLPMFGLMLVTMVTHVIVVHMY